MTASLVLLMQTVLVSEVQRVLQPPPCVLGFSQWHLVLEQLLVVFPVKGNEVRNYLCRHSAASLLAESIRKALHVLAI